MNTPKIGDIVFHKNEPNNKYIVIDIQKLSNGKQLVQIAQYNKEYTGWFDSSEIRGQYE